MSEKEFEVTGVEDGGTILNKIKSSRNFKVVTIIALTIIIVGLLLLLF